MQAPRPRIPCAAALGAIGVPAKRWATRVDLFAQLEEGKAVLARGDGATVAEAARAAGMDADRFQKVFKESEGTDPSTFARIARLDRARGLLQSSSLAVVEIAAECGYENASSFARSYRQRFGHSPTAERVKMSDHAQSPAPTVA